MRALDQGSSTAGEPGEKADKVTLYGGGSVTMRIAPWLQATVLSDLPIIIVVSLSVLKPPE
jgi:hypothetical protein